MNNLSNFTFQHDGAPPHKAKIAKEWLNNNNVKLKNWIVQSPDLNSIEHLWAYLKVKISNRRFFQLMK